MSIIQNIVNMKQNISNYTMILTTKTGSKQQVHGQNTKTANWTQHQGMDNFVNTCSHTRNDKNNSVLSKRLTRIQLINILSSNLIRNLFEKYRVKVFAITTKRLCYCCDVIGTSTQYELRAITAERTEVKWIANAK